MSKESSTTKPVEQLSAILGKLLRVRVMMFALFLGLVYGYTIVKINDFSNVTPSATDISTAIQSNQQKSPQINQSVVDKIEQLKDNSVNVQSLFNQARDNPFQE